MHAQSPLMTAQWKSRVEQQLPQDCPNRLEPELVCERSQVDRCFIEVPGKPSDLAFQRLDVQGCADMLQS